MSVKFFSGGLRKRGVLKKDKKKLPLVSIITVVLNNKKFLQQSINSVLNQSYKNYELIIIDGKSTDGTLEILKKNNSKIDFWISAKDRGIYDAMNKGIKKSHGSIISMLNSDDIYYKNTLKIATNYFNQHQNIDFLFGSVIKYKLLYGYRPWKIHWSFGFYSTHSIGFFIRKKAQKKAQREHAHKRSTKHKKSNENTKNSLSWPMKSLKLTKIYVLIVPSHSLCDLMCFF